MEEVVVEPGDVEGVSLALGGLGRVARPGHPLVAVGLHGHAPVLHPRAPAGVLVDPVDQGVGARELTDGLHVGVGDQALEIVGGGRAREPFDLGIARGVALEARVPGFDPLTLQGVDIEC